ncbi:MAG: hypothetical protein ABI565_01660 [Vicinamibacteria bacterium]
MKNFFPVVTALAAGLALACGERPATGASSEGAGAAAAKPAPKPRPRIELAAGTPLALILDSSLSSKTSREGDRVDAHLASDLMVGTKLVAAAGSPVHGVVTAAVPSGRVKTRARLAFTFDTLVVTGGAEQRIETGAVDITADDTHTRDAVTVGGGAGAGAIIGAITGGKKGAGIGALIGAGAGTGVVLIDKGKNVIFRAGAALSVEMARSVEIRM